MNTCAICDGRVDNKTAQYMGNSVYCENCYPNKKSEEEERRHLFAVICEIFNIDKPTGMMFSQIKNYKEAGLSYRVIRMTLQYLDRVHNMDFQIKYGIGIVKVRFDDMIRYYNNKMKKRREVDMVDYENKTHQISIGKRENKAVQSRMIDINELVEGGSHSGEDRD